MSSLWQLAILSNRAPMTNYYLIIHSHSFKSRGCGRCHSISLVIDRLRPPRSCAYDYFLLNHSFSPINRVHSPRTSHAPMPSYLVIQSHSFTNFGCGSYSFMHSTLVPMANFYRHSFSADHTWYALHVSCACDF